MNRRFETVRRVIITGPMEEYKKALDWCYRNGYENMSSGPIRLDAIKVDPSRFKIVAEKKVG